MEIAKSNGSLRRFQANLFKYIDTLKIRAIRADEFFFDDIDFEDDTPFFSPLISSLILAGKEVVFLLISSIRPISAELFTPQMLLRLCTVRLEK